MASNTSEETVLPTRATMKKPP